MNVSEQENFKEIVEKAERGAAFMCGTMQKASNLAKLLGVQRSQVGRWHSGKAIPSRRFREALVVLAKVADELEAIRLKAEKALENLIEEEKKMYIGLHKLDGMSFNEIEVFNPLAANEIQKMVISRRRKGLCDLCGRPRPRALRPVNSSNKEPFVLRHFEKDSKIIGTCTCKECRIRLDS